MQRRQFEGQSKKKKKIFFEKLDKSFNFLLIKLFISKFITCLTIAGA
jgi:hypothetical protein